MSSLSVDLLQGWPSYDLDAVNQALGVALAESKHKLIVLDDDPTGIQTVHGVCVYTDWSRESLQAGFDEPERMFFLLTNSRAFGAAQTQSVHREIAETILHVANGRPFVLISRGDSTLRGHYPLETETLRAGLAAGGLTIDGEVICPFFPEGGRYTVDNIHYVRDGDRLIPAGETEFAKDQTFGYQSSDLTQWVAEKTQDSYPAGRVITIDLQELRAVDYNGIAAKLSALSDFGKVVVNAVSYDDLKVFATACLRAMAHGKRFIFRSAAALVKVLGGVPDKPTLTTQELRGWDNATGCGGLIVVGSHVNKTSQQLERLQSSGKVASIQLNQHLALDPAAFATETDRVIDAAETAIASGQTVVVYTKRERLDLPYAGKEEQLRLAGVISDQVTSVVARLKVRPLFLIAKGGITSSDIGTKALGVKKAMVLGQILPGVPVWLTGPESKFPQLPYVIFPGNVGDENALLDAVNKFIHE